MPSPQGSTHQAPWGLFLVVTKVAMATLPQHPKRTTWPLATEPTPLTGQGQGVVPPAGRQHDGFMAERLDEPGGFHPLGVAMSQLPLLVPACRWGAGWR